MMTASPLRVWVAGTSEYSRLLAERLFTAESIQFQGVITPEPKPVGRDQVLTASPLADWAENKNIPKILVSEKIDANVKNQINEQFSLLPCDVLLVVDFGYYVPRWLLALPTIAPINVHPSRLPAWRGSSPAQRVLFAGEPTSAVTVLKVTPEMDAGDILTQLEFDVEPTWTSQDYYDSAFGLVARQLAQILVNFAAGTLKATPQPIASPTPMAERLSKTDSYVPWSILAATAGLSHAETDFADAPQTGLLQETLKTQTVTEQAHQIERAVRAFSPWPKVWTVLPTTKGWKRLILHHAAVTNQTLQLTRVQLEGKDPSTWNEIKNNWAPQKKS